MPQRYLIALGSNMRHHRYGSPAAVLRAAVAVLAHRGVAVQAAGPIITSAPLGPSRRRYANAAVLVETALLPDALLILIKMIEHSFGRRRAGQRWASRVLDLDIVLWNGGAWSSPGLTVPHPAFRTRDFVLGPALPIAGDWRDPLSGLSLRQLQARLTRASTLPKRDPWSGP